MAEQRDSGRVRPEMSMNVLDALLLQLVVEDASFGEVREVTEEPALRLQSEASSDDGAVSDTSRVPSGAAQGRSHKAESAFLE
jgi:hypothetical protein